MQLGPDCIDESNHHFSFYRDHFPWGQTPAYRTPDGAHYRFWCDGQTWTPEALANHLCEQYEQTHEVAVRQAMTRYAELRALPRCSL